MKVIVPETLSISECLKVLHVSSIEVALHQTYQTSRDKKIQNRLRQLKQQDDAAFGNCRSQQDYETYLRNWPDGQYVNIAKNMVLPKGSNMPKPQPKKKYVSIAMVCLIFVAIIITLLLVGNRSKDTGEETDSELEESGVEDKVDIEGGANVDRIVEDMVYVEGGTFYMGVQNLNPSGINYNPSPFAGNNVHRVTIGSFYICKHEVTQREWESVMGNNPAFHTGLNRPVENVSWNDCLDFISKLNQMTGKHFRLPTEEEWEYAARGGTRNSGNNWAGFNSESSLDSYAWIGGGGSHDVMQKKANELGLYDMSGNVSEWTSSLYKTDPELGRLYYVTRGGAYCYSEYSMCVWSRGYRISSEREVELGLRLVLDAS